MTLPLPRRVAVGGLLAALVGCHKHLPTEPTRVTPTPPPEEARPPVLPEPQPPELPPRWPPLAARLAPVHFAFDSADLDGDARAVLAEDAALLADHPELRLQIEGHCDERGTTEYNLALGERRADAVRDLLAAHGIAASRLATLSYGEERPVATGHDEAAWALNRRGELRLVGQADDTRIQTSN